MPDDLTEYFESLPPPLPPPDYTGLRPGERYSEDELRSYIGELPHHRVHSMLVDIILELDNISEVMEVLIARHQATTAGG